MAQFDGSKSSTTAETIMTFLDAFRPDMGLDEVPGIGPVSVDKLGENGVLTIQQLLGKYLSFVTKDADSQVANQAFFDWFKSQVPKANAHTVTFAMAHVVDNTGLFKYED